MIMANTRNLEKTAVHLIWVVRNWLRRWSAGICLASTQIPIGAKTEPITKIITGVWCLVLTLRITIQRGQEMKVTGKIMKREKTHTLN